MTSCFPASPFFSVGGKGLSGDRERTLCLPRTALIFPIVYRLDTVHVWAYQDSGSQTPPIFIGEASREFTWSDVGGACGAQFAPSGYNIVVTGLAGGHTYRIAVFPHSSVKGTFSVRTVDVVG
jgi:hypothetical protein